jgi:hypothetical protein
MSKSYQKAYSEFLRELAGRKVDMAAAFVAGWQSGYRDGSEVFESVLEEEEDG